MLSRNQLKYIRLLSQKKYRIREGQFVLGGDKLVRLAVEQGIVLKYCLGLPSWEKDNKALIDRLSPGSEYIPVNEREMAACSPFKSPPPVMAVLPMLPEVKVSALDQGIHKKLIYLEEISDPGNAGTILRIADWFGFDSVILSPDSVDWYNPKLVQASMGSIFRFNPCYASLEEIAELKEFRLILADLDGDDPQEVLQTVKSPFILAFGNEAHGASAELMEKSQVRISIPGHKKRIAESLNVANSSAILMYLFKDS